MNTLSKAQASARFRDEDRDHSNLAWLARIHTDELQQAFNTECKLRGDAADWRRLEQKVAGLLRQRWQLLVEPRAQRGSSQERFERLNDEIERKFSMRLMVADMTRNRESAYGRAVSEVLTNTASWFILLHPAQAAFWQHASLVWMALWHASANPKIGAVDAAHCLGDEVGYVAPAEKEALASGESYALENTTAPQPVSQAVGLGDRSVMAGNLFIEADSVHKSRVGIALQLSVSAIIGSWAFCLCIAFGSIVTPIPLATGFWLAAFPISGTCAMLWGLFAGAVMMRRAGKRLTRAMQLAFVGPDHALQQRLAAMTAAIGFDIAPRLGIYEGDDINAFAVSDRGGGSVIGLSRAAADQLSPGQLDALLAHELGHIASGDMARLIYAQSFQRSLVWWMLFSPLKTIGRWIFSALGEMVVLGLSRSREYRADMFAAAIAGKANMISLLEAVKNQPARIPAAAKVAPELFFNDPAKRLFATHPPLAARIMAVEGEQYVGKLRLKVRVFPA